MDEVAAREVEGLGGETRVRGDKAGVVVGCTAIGSMVSGQGSSSADKRNNEPAREATGESLLIFAPFFSSRLDALDSKWEKLSGLDKIWTRPVMGLACLKSRPNLLKFRVIRIFSIVSSE